MAMIVLIRRHELPPVPHASQQPGAGVGPAYGEDSLNRAGDADEHPGSALERELQRTRIA